MDVKTKLQEVDKMLDMRQQLDALQRSLGIYNGFEMQSSILICKVRDFFELSKSAKSVVYKTGYITDYGAMEVAFNYKGYKFVTFIFAHECEEYKDRIASDENDAD